jgi:hypothetical protein
LEGVFTEGFDGVTGTLGLGEAGRLEDGTVLGGDLRGVGGSS